MIESSSDAVVREVEYAHPIDIVWAALTTDDAISQWLMPARGFKAEVGAKFTMAYPDGQGGRGGTVDCEVLNVDEPHRLTYTWTSGPVNTTVTYHLASTGNGTKLRLEQVGFDSIEGDNKPFRNGAQGGWTLFLQKNLPGVLDSLAILRRTEVHRNG